MKILFRSTSTNCSGSEPYAFHPAVIPLCILLPLLNGVTIGFFLGLIRLLARKLTAHPISNALLLNAALGGLFTAVDMLYRTSYNILALITRDACYLTMTKQVCAIQYARLLIGLSIFNLSLIFAGIERAVVGTQSYVRMYRRKQTESLFPFSVAFLAAAAASRERNRRRVGPSGSVGERRTSHAENVGGGGSSTKAPSSLLEKDFRRPAAQAATGGKKSFTAANNKQRTKPPPKKPGRAFQSMESTVEEDSFLIKIRDMLISNCCGGGGEREVTIEGGGSAAKPSCISRAVSSKVKDILSVAVLSSIMWSLVIVPHVVRVSRLASNPNERMNFCTGQRQELASTHVVSVVFNLASLGIYAYASAISKERSQLRYNLHVTYMIGPVIIHTCVCVTLNSLRFLVYNVYDSLNPVSASIINIYIFLLVNYSPLLFYAAYSYRSFRMLQVHGPSLVITMPTNSTQKMHKSSSVTPTTTAILKQNAPLTQRGTTTAVAEGGKLQKEKKFPIPLTAAQRKLYQQQRSICPDPCALDAPGCEGEKCTTTAFGRTLCSVSTAAAAAAAASTNTNMDNNSKPAAWKTIRLPRVRVQEPIKLSNIRIKPSSAAADENGFHGGTVARLGQTHGRDGDNAAAGVGRSRDGDIHFDALSMMWANDTIDVAISRR